MCSNYGKRVDLSDLKDHTNKAINFYVKKNALVYMYVAPNMTMDDTWFLLDDAAHVQDAWYSQGWKLYMKRVGEKQNVSVNVPKECALPIIVVKEEPEIETEMMFERFSAWDDVYYGGRKSFRSGVQVHVDAKVNPIAVEQILPVTRKWSVIMNGVETPLNNLWFDIPLVTEDTELTFRYKIDSADGKCESMVEKTIIVSPPDAPEVLYPWYR